MKMMFLAAALAVAACLGFTPTAKAQDRDPFPVAQRVRTLESEVKELKAEVAALKLGLLSPVQAAAPKAACRCGIDCPCAETSSAKAAPAVCLPGQPCYQVAAAAGYPPGTLPSAPPVASYGGPSAGSSSACAGGSCSAGAGRAGPIRRPLGR